MCIEGAGFDGYLSRVEVWNRVLSYTDEIPTLAEGRTKSQSIGRTLRWTGYLSYTGMRIMRPSSAGDGGQATGKCPPFLCRRVLWSSLCIINETCDYAQFVILSLHILFQCTSYVCSGLLKNDNSVVSCLLQLQCFKLRC